MKLKIRFFAISVILIHTTMFSQIVYDTTSTRQVGPGIFHTSVLVEKMPWTLDVLEVDLTQEVNFIETATANGILGGNERTGSMAAKEHRDGNIVVGAVNADFYSTGGIPVGAEIKNREIIKGPKFPNPYSTFGFNGEKTPEVERVKFTGSLQSYSGQIIINGINTTRSTDYLVLFNSYVGSTTGTNQWGTELLVTPLDGWKVNDTVACVIESKQVYIGNMAIPKGKAVLSGHGKAHDFLSANLQIGDTVKLYLGITPGLNDIVTMVGGFPKIISNETNYALQGYSEEGGGSDFATARHPRTAVGYNQDKTKLFLVTVDGRQTTSVGMSLPELADFMLSIGCYTAVNLDGGGSTTMVVRNKIVNSPSDPGGERRVANSLMVVAKVKVDIPSRIRLNKEKVVVERNQNFNFSVELIDKYFNPLGFDGSELKYSTSSSFGTIAPIGQFSAGNNADSGFVYAEYREFKDSCFVIVNSTVKLKLNPKSTVTDSTKAVNFILNGIDLFGNVKSISNAGINWSVDDSEKGIIGADGKFYGRKNGIVKVIAKWENLSDTAKVEVIIGVGEKALESFEDFHQFNMTGKDIDTLSSSIELSDSFFTEGSNSMKVNYQFQYRPGVQNWLYVNKDISVAGVPSKIALDVRTNNFDHSVAFVIEDDDSESFALVMNKLANKDYEFETLTASHSNPIPLGSNSRFNYPIIIKQIAFILGSGRVAEEIYSGEFYIDNLRIQYPDFVSSVVISSEQPAEFKLYQNYPNPFNPSTIIKFQVPSSKFVKLQVHDLLGREVQTLVNEYKTAGIYEVEFNASHSPGGRAGLSSGIYFYKLNSGGYSKIKKMVLIR
ncbi:MAG: phosphodiester glycosidase family protein [Bacteroidota bacterium]